MISRPQVSPSSPQDHSAAEPEWHLVQRIVSSASFVRSPRLADFLLYICDCALKGRAQEISEQQIGVHVFKRAANYNPNEDSIVRSHARLLRQRLELYFQEEGKREELRICIPKGRYVPVFKPTDIARPDGSSIEFRVPAPIPRNRSRRFWLFTALVLGGLLLLAAASRWIASETSSRPMAHKFWANFFSSGKRVLIIPADSALALFEDLTQEPVRLSEYLNRKYRFDLKGHSAVDERLLSSIAGRQYTSMADLNLAVRLTRLREAAARQPEVRYARNLQLTDLKESSAVLIGGPRANPWTELFQDKMNFYVEPQPSAPQNSILNKSPRPGESAAYNEAQGEASVRAYGVLAFLPGLRPDTRMLVVEGTSSAGTECAADFLLDESSLNSFIEQISRARKKLPYFEVLLQSPSVAGNAQQPQIAAYRILDR